MNNEVTDRETNTLPFHPFEKQQVSYLYIYFYIFLMKKFKGVSNSSMKIKVLWKCNVLKVIFDSGLFSFACVGLQSVMSLQTSPRPTERRLWSFVL